jgi:Mn2+/Fe2+ NRAMP family transporter
MSKLLTLALGLLTAIGSGVDIGDVVFASQSGASFGYSLIWALIVGVIGLMIYGEMSGRVAAITKLTTFDIIRRDYPPKLSFVTLVLSVIVTFITCAAEIGGVALILELLSTFSYEILIIIAVIAIGTLCWFLSFKKIENVLGYGGLLVVIFAIAAIKSTPSVEHFASGLLPWSAGGSALSYWYFAIGLIAASLMPYEIYFYSSGGIEEKWKAKNLNENRRNSYIGFGVAALVIIGIIVVAANTLLPNAIAPDFVGAPILGVLASMGQVSALVALLGLLFAISGSTVETAFAGAYNLSQFAGWKWGRRHSPQKTPKFTASWLIILALGAVVIMSGVDPVQLTEYAVIFSVIIMPLTYYPVVKVARDKQLMGEYANGRITNILAYIYLLMIVLVSVAAIPLMIFSHQGQL